MANGAAIALIFPILVLILDGSLDGFSQSIAQVLLLTTLGARWVAILWFVNELLRSVVYKYTTSG